MPELPEVEVTKNSLLQLQGLEISSYHSLSEKLRYPLPKEIPLGRVKRIWRRSKYIIFELTNNNSLITHLGMSGHFIIDPIANWKHTQYRISFENGDILSYIDPRKFGFLIVVPTSEVLSHKLIAKLAPEPLTDDFKFDDFYSKIKSKKVAIKKIIMDNSNIVGVGNIYASESLFMSNIHPEQKANEIKKTKLLELFNNMISILRLSIELGGTSIRDFYHINGTQGEFRKMIKAYGREGLPCENCQDTIKKVVIGGRSSFFCETCCRKSPT